MLVDARVLVLSLVSSPARRIRAAAAVFPSCLVSSHPFSAWTLAKSSDTTTWVQHYLQFEVYIAVTRSQLVGPRLT